MYKCPYCDKTTNSLNRHSFPDWYHVAKHVKSCSKKTGEYYIDSIEGPIHYSQFMSSPSSDYIRYKYPKLVAGQTYIRNHFKKFGISIPYPNKEWKKEELISVIQDFYIDNDRIPTNREFNNPSSVYPTVTPFIRVFGSWNTAIEQAGYKPNDNLYGITNKALDGTTYRSLLESSFVNKFLINKYEYMYECRYPAPYNLIYDFYIDKLSLYIEVAGGTSESYISNTFRKIEINKALDRNLLVVYSNDIDNFSTLEDLISGSQTYYGRNT